MGADSRDVAVGGEHAPGACEKFAAVIDRIRNGIAADCRPEDKIARGCVKEFTDEDPRARGHASGLRHEDILRLKILFSPACCRHSGHAAFSKSLQITHTAKRRPEKRQAANSGQSRDYSVLKVLMRARNTVTTGPGVKRIL
jgi:hypothetical protein